MQADSGALDDHFLKDRNGIVGGMIDTGSRDIDSGRRGRAVAPARQIFPGRVSAAAAICGDAKIRLQIGKGSGPLCDACSDLSVSDGIADTDIHVCIITRSQTKINLIYNCIA